jgi:hypothetical protein
LKSDFTLFFWNSSVPLQIPMARQDQTAEDTARDCSGN